MRVSTFVDTPSAREIAARVHPAAASAREAVAYRASRFRADPFVGERLLLVDDVPVWAQGLQQPGEPPIRVHRQRAEVAERREHLERGDPSLR